MGWVGIAYIGLLVMTILLGILMLAYAWPRRHVPGGQPVAAMLALIVLWAGCVLGELSSDTFEAKLLFFNLRQMSLVTLPVTWFVLAVEVYRQEEWRSLRLLLALHVWPAIIFVLSVTNHPLLREAVFTRSGFGLTVIATERGSAFMLEAAYSYTMILGGIILLADLLRRTVPGQRHQTGALIIGISLTIVGNLLDLTGLNPIAPLGPIVLMFVPASLCFMWGLFRQRLLDVLPVAHSRVLEAITDGVMVVNSAGNIVDLNPAARDIFARALPNHPPMLGRPVTEALAGWTEWQVSAPEARTRFEVTVGADSGTTIYDVAVTTLKTRRGMLLGQVLLINDVTAEKQAFLLRTERERIQVLQQFLRDASHDIRTPMSVIQSSAYLIKRLADKQIEDLASLHPRLPQVYAAVIEGAIDTTGKLRDRAVASDDAARRLWSILQGMFELAELEAAASLDKLPLDVNAIIELVLRLRAEESAQHAVTIETALDRSLAPVLADEKRLTRAIDAVIINAIQYTPSGGSVMVRTMSANEHVCVEVTDTGIGIGEANLTRIFERFYRIDQARSTETGGAGLGLTLAKAILEAHDGHIRVTSTLGKGSTFTLLLPR